MKYYLVVDFGTKAEAKDKTELYKLFGGRNEMIDNNGGVMPDIYEITEEEYEQEDEYDVI